MNFTNYSNYESISNLVHKEESYFAIGLCMEIHNTLGKGFSEAVYADALKFELESISMPCTREMKFDTYYKDKLLRKKYYVDFVIDDKIILELKAIEGINSSHVKQPLNYLAASKLKLGIVVNFGEDHLKLQKSSSIL